MIAADQWESRNSNLKCDVCHASQSAAKTTMAEEGVWNTGDADVENDPKVRLYLRSSAMDQSSADQEPELTPEEITKHLTNHFGENIARAFEGQYLQYSHDNKKGFI